MALTVSPQSLKAVSTVTPAPTAGVETQNVTPLEYMQNAVPTLNAVLGRFNIGKDNTLIPFHFNEEYTSRLLLGFAEHLENVKNGIPDDKESVFGKIDPKAINPAELDAIATFAKNIDSQLLQLVRQTEALEQLIDSGVLKSPDEQGISATEKNSRIGIFTNNMNDINRKIPYDRN